MKFPHQFNSAAAYKHFVGYQKKQDKDRQNHAHSAVASSSPVHAHAPYGGLRCVGSEKKVVHASPACEIMSGADLPAIKKEVSSITRGRDFHQMAMVQKAAFLLALFSMFKSASAMPLSRRDGAMEKAGAEFYSIDSASAAIKIERQKNDVAAVHSPRHPSSLHDIEWGFMRAYIRKKSLSNNEASIEVIAPSQNTASLSKKSHQRRATQVLSDQAMTARNNTSAAYLSEICALSGNSMAFVVSQSELARAAVIDQAIAHDQSRDTTLTPGNTTDLSIDPVRNSMDFAVRTNLIEDIAATFLVYQEMDEWLDLNRARIEISNPYQAFLAIAARADYPDDHLSIEVLGQTLAQGKSMDDWLAQTTVAQQHAFHQAALLYMQARHPDWPIWSSLSCFQIQTTYPLSMLSNMAREITHVYHGFATQVRETWQKSQIFADTTSANETLAQRDRRVGSGVDHSDAGAANEIPQEPAAPKRCVGKTICFDGFALVHAKGKTFDDLLGDASLARIPGFASLAAQTQRRLLRARLHEIRQSTEYTFGSVPHSMASTLITLHSIKGQPVPDRFGTEAQLVQRFIAACQEWKQTEYAISPKYLMGLHLANTRGEKIFSKKSTPQQRLQLINHYVEEVMLAHYGKAPQKYHRDQRIAALIARKVRLTDYQVRTQLIEFSSCRGNYCETKRQTPLTRFNQILARNTFTDNMRVNGLVIYPVADLQEDERQYNAELSSNDWIKASAKENLRKNNTKLTTDNINDEIASLARQYKTTTEHERDWERGLVYAEKIPIFGGVVTMIDGIVHHDLDKIIGAIPVIGGLYNIVEAIETKDWQRGLSALPIIGNAYDFEEGLRTGNAMRTYFAGANLLVEMGSYHKNMDQSASPKRLLSVVELPENMAHGIQINAVFSEKIGLSFQGIKIKKPTAQTNQANNHVPIFNFKDPFGIEKSNIKNIIVDNAESIHEAAQDNPLQETEENASQVDINEDDTWLICGARAKRSPDSCFSTKEKRSTYFNALKDNLGRDEKLSCQKRFAMSQVFEIERDELSATEKVTLKDGYKKYIETRKKEIKRDFISAEDIRASTDFLDKLVKSEQIILDKGIDILNQKFDSDFSQKKLINPALERSDFIRLPKFKLTVIDYPYTSKATRPLILIQLKEGESTENIAEGLHAIAASVMHNTDYVANFKIEIGDIGKDRNIIISNAPQGGKKSQGAPQDKEVMAIAAAQNIIIKPKDSRVYFATVVGGEEKVFIDYLGIYNALQDLFKEVPAASAAKTIYTFLQKAKWEWVQSENISLETEQKIKAHLAIYAVIVNIAEEQRTTGTAALSMRIHEEYAAAPGASTLLPEVSEDNNNFRRPSQSVFFNKDNQLLPFMKKGGAIEQRTLFGSPQQLAHKNYLAERLLTVTADAQGTPPKKRLKTTAASDGDAVPPHLHSITARDIRDELWAGGAILTKNAVLNG